MGLLSPVAPVKPLADVVTENPCRDRHKEIDEEFHSFTPPLCCQIGRGSRDIVTGFDKVRKHRARIFSGRDRQSRKNRYNIK